VVAVNEARDVPESGLRRAIDTSLLLDADGNEYDIAVAQTPAAGKILHKRALAAKLLDRNEATRGLKVRFEQEVASADVDSSPVSLFRHIDAEPLALADLTIAQCTSLGTAIASIHLLDPAFLVDAGYPRFTAEEIRSDLAAWAQRLPDSPEVPGAIAERWQQLVTIDALWSFEPVTLHGDFRDNDVVFRDDSVAGVRHWENIQVSDPARDFAWAYEDWFGDDQRDALLSAYGRMMGSRMDARIVPRARLWRQMDIVRDLLQALKTADRAWIRAAHERVDRLATLLTPVIPVTSKSTSDEAVKEASATITVGNLLADVNSDSVVDVDDSTNARLPEHTPSTEKPLSDKTGYVRLDDIAGGHDTAAPSETPPEPDDSATTIILKNSTPTQAPPEPPVSEDTHGR